MLPSYKEAEEIQEGGEQENGGEGTIIPLKFHLWILY